MKYLLIKVYDCFIQFFFEMFGIICKFLRECEENFDLVKSVQDFILGFFCVRNEVKMVGDGERFVFFFDDYFVNDVEVMFVVGYEIISIILKWVIVYLVNYLKYQEDI